MREINANYTKIRICLDNRNKFIFKTKCKNPRWNNVRGIVLNMRVKQRNLATSNDLHSFHPDKKILFRFWSVWRILGKNNAN